MIVGEIRIAVRPSEGGSSVHAVLVEMERRCSTTRRKAVSRPSTWSMAGAAITPTWARSSSTGPHAYVHGRRGWCDLADGVHALPGSVQRRALDLDGEPRLRQSGAGPKNGPVMHLSPLRLMRVLN